MTKIMGAAVATANQMAAYLLSVNPEPKINMKALDFCKLFLTVAAWEGVRGDILFAQSLHETGNFKFTGTVVPEQNNYAGIGTTSATVKGAYFKDEAEGILAQAQHAKAYATTESLNCSCVDPRYSLLISLKKAGTAQHWEELGGKWAVPGYSTGKYNSLEEANAAEDSYGYKIMKIYNKILTMPKGEEATMTKIIALDAGHGMKTSGKRCLKSIDANQTREWWLNDRITDKVEALLKSYDCKVVRVDDTTGAKDIALATRVKTANNAKADVYISMHHNAGINGRSGGGTVVFYYSSKKEREEQAWKLYNAIVKRTGLVGNRYSKVAKKEFYVIKNTTMPSFLVENGFMDSTVDTPVILTAEHAEKTAQAVLSFLVDYLNLEKKNAPEIATQSAYYPQYTGKTTTLSAALTSLGINSTYTFRTKIAKANNIKGYIGTAAQNIQMYNLLKAGLLKRA